MSIHGLLQLTKMESDAKELKSYHEMMEGRVANLDKLIRDITDYARNSRQPIALGNTAVKKLILDAIENLRFFPGSENVKIHRQVPDDMMITTDLTRLQIILNNLISNAFKYYDSKKNNSFIRISSKEQRDKIIFTIEDNGIGIPHDSLNRIFEMYTRAHEQSFGSGLGLYIVKETVEKLQGNIHVQSSVGEGSIFTLEIPSSLEVATKESEKNESQMNA
jgi:signal transduction histidine kinase